jgi:hypothetical protein
VIAGAAADIAFQPVANFFLAGVGIAVHQVDRAHHHAWRAKPALQAVIVAKRLLHRMQSVTVGQAFNGRHFGALGLHRQHRARLHGGAIHMHHAGAALACVATHMGSGQVEVLAQKLHQQCARLDLSLNGFTVHCHGKVRHPSLPCNEISHLPLF